MRTEFSRRRNIFMANYGRNAVMHLIIACGVGYILLQAVKVIFIVTSDAPQTIFSERILPQVALQPFASFIHHPWVLLTYFWGHISFFTLLSNMLWLYCFGSVIQSFVGYREVLPLFLVSCILGGALFVAISYLWKTMPSVLIVNGLPGVTAFALSAFILVPGYRFYLGDRLAIPLWAVLLIFLLLNVLSVAGNTPFMILLACSALAGAGYMWLLKAGYQPGARIYGWGDKIQSFFGPDYRHLPHRASGKRSQTLKNLTHRNKNLTPEYIDMLLDKINQKGYKSLTAEEKDALMKASRERE